MEFNEIKYGNHPGAEDEYYMDLKFKELIVIFNMAITCESGEKFDKEELIKSFVGYVNQRLEEIIKKYKFVIFLFCVLMLTCLRIHLKNIFIECL
ncbi:MAG: hypothetical protein H7A34_01720 [bacterium]|nr:hypothetical protein [bacterium]